MNLTMVVQNTNKLYAEANNICKKTILRKNSITHEGPDLKCVFRNINKARVCIATQITETMETNPNLQ